LAANLVDPNGQPYPAQFTQPADVALAAVCPGTGKKAPSGPATAAPNNGGRRAPTPVPTTPPAPGPYSVAVPPQRGREDWFPVNQPGVACGVLTPDENDELALALRDIQRNAGKYTSGAIESVLAYRNAATNFKPPPYNQNAAPTAPPRR
jgi:hypothetical protein